MKKPVILVICILLILIVWNSSQKQIKIGAPAPNQNVGMQFTLSGEIASTLLKDSSFGIELFDKDGTSVLGQVVDVSIPWWAQFVSVPISFNQKIDTSGMTAETPTCFEKATLVVSSFSDKTSSTSIPISCAVQ